MTQAAVEELQAEEQASEETTPTPSIEEELAGVKAGLAQLHEFRQRTEGRIGQMMQDMAEIKSLPRGPARDERIDQLAEEWNAYVETLDPETQVSILKGRGKRPAPKREEEAPTTRAALTPDQLHWNKVVAPAIQKYVKPKNIPWSELIAHPEWPKEIDSFRAEDDPDGWAGFIEAAEAVADKIEDARTKATAARTRVPTERGASTNKNPLQVYLDDLKAGRPIKLTPAEIDQLYASNPIS